MDGTTGEQNTNVIFSVFVPLRSCTVSFTGPSGVVHTVEVVAESLYDAAVMGLNVLKRDGWVEAVASGTMLCVQVREPATMHSVAVGQLQRWCDGGAVSPEESLRKRKMKQLLE